MASIWEFRPEDWAHIMQADVNSSWYLSKIFTGQMRDAGDGGVSWRATGPAALPARRST
jgi:hypothetical protein